MLDEDQEMTFGGLPKLARTGPPAMSAIRSLSGEDRTWRRQPSSVENDPTETTAYISFEPNWVTYETKNYRYHCRGIFASHGIPREARADHIMLVTHRRRLLRPGEGKLGLKKITPSGSKCRVPAASITGPLKSPALVS